MLDLIDECVSRMILYKIDRPTDECKQFAGIIVDATKLLLEGLQDLKNSEHYALQRKCIEVHTLENEGDRIEQLALSKLFEEGRDPIDVIKWKDIYEDLEAAVDRTEDVAATLEGIVLKNA